MKTIILVVLSLVAIANALTKDEAKEIFLKVEAVCRTKTGATEEHLKNLMNHTPLVDAVGKCYGGCILEDLGMLKNNKMVKEGFMIGANLLFNGDAEKIKLAEAAIDSCADKTGPDSCEAAFAIGSCLKAAYDASGLNAKWD